MSKWQISEWGKPQGFEDLAIDSKADRLYASSAHLDSVLVFDLKGTKVAATAPRSPDKLRGPSALALANGKLYVLNIARNHVSVIELNQ